MNIINFLINEIFIQAPVLLGLVAFAGLMLQKKSGEEVLEGTIKTIVGIVILNSGIGVFLGSLMPLTSLLNNSFGITGVLPDCFGPFGIAMQTYGLEIPLAFVLAFVIHLLLVRFLPFEKTKNVFLTGHIMLFNTSIMIIVGRSTLGLTGTAQIVFAAIMTALFWTLMPAIARPFSDPVTDKRFTLGHLQTMDLPVGTWLGGLVKSKRSDEIELPGIFNLFSDYTVLLCVLIPILYILIGVAAGQEAVVALSGGANWIIWLIMQGFGFAAGITIVLYGVRMFLAAMIPAFEGISQKLLPGAQPALDSPLFFQYSPAGSMLGFVSCFFTMVIFTVVQIAIGSAVVIFPGPIFFFFDGALAGVFGDLKGGWVGAILAGAGIALVINFAALLTYPFLSDFFAGTGVMFGGGDYIIWAPVFYVLKLVGGMLGLGA
jgi:PTS system ascorbate-specific IIC component